MDQLHLRLNRPTQPGELEFGECAPIVSTCGLPGCGKHLTIDNIIVMEDGEHVCRDDRCAVEYEKFLHRGEIT